MAEAIKTATFETFQAAEKAILGFCKQNFHPVHVDYKEKVGSYNKKVKEDSRITTLSTDDVYACV